MILPERKFLWLALTIVTALVSGLTLAYAQQEPQRGATSYMTVDPQEPFAATMARMRAAQPAIQKRQADLLAERYDLASSAAAGVTMSRGKPVQAGVRARLPAGATWEQLANTTPNDIRERDLFPKAFFPLPHPNHPEGGMLFPKLEIEEIKKQEARDLTRFDLEFDLPDHSCRNFRHRSISPRGPISVTCRSASWSPSTITTSCSAAS
jgi:cytochrome c peroxidase